MINYFRGMEIDQTKESIFMCQKNYATNILEKFNMDRCNPISTPQTQNDKLSKDDNSGEAHVKLYRSIIGSLLYCINLQQGRIYCMPRVCYQGLCKSQHNYT